jgi:hypothetical protein
MPFVDDKFRKEECERIVLMIEAGELKQEDLKQEYRKAIAKKREKNEKV